MDENKEENKLSGLYMFLVICALLVFLLWIMNLYFDAIGGNPFEFSDLKDDESKRSALGALGDYFGGLLNPILAFLSFIALLWTLKLNQEELAETRKELARAANAQEDSKKVMDQQLKTQTLQQCDNLFALMFKQLIESQNEVVLVINNYSNSSELSLDVVRNAIKKDTIIRKYFRLLYQTFFILRDCLKENEKLSDFSKNKLNQYIRVIRSQQDSRVLEALFIFISENRANESDFNLFLKQSNFFKHLSLDDSDSKFWTALKSAFKDFESEDKELYFRKDELL